MESADAKFARAVEHFQTYNSDASQFVKTVEHNLVIKHNPETGAKWLVFWDSDQIPPIRLSAIVGDVLFNLRSALDNLVCGLARRADSSADCETLQFPICTSEEAFDNGIRKRQLEGISVDAVRMIRSVQPFLLGENSAKLHALALIHDLNNRDKHRAVHITVGASQNTEVLLLDESNVPVHRVRLTPGVPTMTTTCLAASGRRQRLRNVPLTRHDRERHLHLMRHPMRHALRPWNARGRHHFSPQSPTLEAGCRGQVRGGSDPKIRAHAHPSSRGRSRP